MEQNSTPRPAVNRDSTIVDLPSSDELVPGMILRGRFVLERLLGEGGMGRVFLAVDREIEGSNRYVAIKVLGAAFRAHPQSLSALRREATNSRQLNHPNIVGVYHFDRDGAHVFIVMEYMRGQSLDAFIAANKGGLPYDQVWPMVQSCASALAHMHARHVIHSDFKPSNVFVTESNEVKVLDLGIARTLDETMAVNGATRFDPGALGAMTPQYASCEMFERQTPDPRDDLYALGCVTYELLTGSHPYDREPAIAARARKMHPKRPRGLKARSWKALEHTLAFARADRIFSAEEFIAEFGPSTTGTNATPWIAASVLLVLSIVGAWYWSIPSPDDRFITETLAEYRGNPDSDVTDEQAEAWIEQGQYFTSRALTAFQAGDYRTGLYALQDGPSPARLVYMRLLALPEERYRKVAAAGLLEMSKIYVVAVQGLSTANPEEGLRFTCEGLRLNRYEPSLKDWYNKLRDTVPATSAIERCNGVDELLDGQLLDGPLGGRR